MEQMSLISKKKGERIDKFLGENLDDLSRYYIQKLLDNNIFQSFLSKFYNIEFVYRFCP